MKRKITKAIQLAILTLPLALLTIAPKGYCQDIQPKDQASTSPVPQKRSLTLCLPLLEPPKIKITNRDPFVSAEVKDPYVINKPIDQESETPFATEKLISYLEDTIKKSLASSIKILGVSSGEPEKGNYALIQGTQPESENYDGSASLIKEGDVITLTLQGDSLRKLQEAVIVSAQQGFKLDIGIEIEDPNQDPASEATPSSTNTEVIIKKIDRRKVTFLHKPTQQEFEVKFEKDLRIRPREDNKDTTNQEPSPKSPPPPPKI